MEEVSRGFREIYAYDTGSNTQPAPLYTLGGLGLALLLSGLICVLVGCLGLALEEDQKNSIARIESDLSGSRNYILENRYGVESADRIKKMRFMMQQITVSTGTLRTQLSDFIYIKRIDVTTGNVKY